MKRDRHGYLSDCLTIGYSDRPIVRICYIVRLSDCLAIPPSDNQPAYLGSFKKLNYEMQPIRPFVRPSDCRTI
jgi:hypothetical protein